jgi:hypothetical protein
VEVIELNAERLERQARLDRAAEPVGRRTEPCARAKALGETMREILFRDGGVTETALIAEGYTAAEIVEHGEDARRHAGLALVVTGQTNAGSDRLPDVVAKACQAKAHRMPLIAGGVSTGAMAAAWHDYCASRAAHALDPWVSQSERCLHRLHAFLHMQPLLPREANTVVQAVAADLKRRVRT